MEDYKSTSNKEPLYSHAFNEYEELVHIEQVTDEYRNIHQFKCPSCGKKMIAKIKGEQRCPHFAHDTSKCDYDKYLHEVAKCKLTDLFNNSDETIYFQYVFNEYCNANECNFFKEGCNKHSELKIINLKEKYDKCEKEKSIKGNDGNNYIADILLSDSKGEEKPLLLEIWHTNKCSAEKLNSGLQIVEIKIDSEQDIDQICSSRIIKESSTVKLYGFNLEKEFNPTPYWCNIPNTAKPSISNAAIPPSLFEEEIDIELPAEFDILQYLDPRHNAEHLRNIQNIVFHGSLSIPFQLESYCLRALSKCTGSKFKLWAQDSEVGFPYFAKKAADFAGFPIKQIKCDWSHNKDMKSMQAQLLSELFAFADALIIFDDTTINYELEMFYKEAEQRNLPIFVIPFNQKDGLCPKCGRKMILKDRKAICPKCYHSSLVSY